MPPTLGLKPTQPQKLAGRRIEPTTCVPSAAGTMPQVTAAAEPLLEPPGVRSRSQGLRVPRGSVAANSVVTTLPRITAPASRNAATLAASRPVRQPTNRGEPCSVGLAAGSGADLAHRRGAGSTPTGAAADKQGRALFGRHVGGLDDVLDAERHAVDRRQTPAGAPACPRGGS